jgi:hypothetical protein
VPKTNNNNVAALFCAALILAMPAHAAEVKSPDGRIVFAVELDADGRVLYAVTFGEEKIIAPSRLGFRFEDHAPIETSLRVVDNDSDRAHWQTNPYDYAVEEIEIDREQSLELLLAAGGGVAIRFRPKPKAGS